MGKDLNSKIQDVEEKIKELQAEKQQLVKKSKEEERKKRTRNLIQIGAILDSLGIKTTEQAEKLKQELKNHPEILESIKDEE